MARFMAPLNSYTYAVLRIVTGLLFMFHGSQKLLGWPVPPMDGMPPFITYIAGPIELIRRRAGDDRTDDALGGVHLQRSDGRRVLDGACEQGAVSDAERRRTRNRLLLRVPVHLVAGSRHLEPGRDARYPLSDRGES